MLSAGVQEQDCPLCTDLCSPPINCCALQNFQENILRLLHVTACSVPTEEQVDTDEQQTRDRLCRGGRWVGEFLACADDFYFALEVAHWRIQINVTAFNFSLFLSLSFTLGLFNFPWSFFVASVHPGDRCTIGALKLRNVYIIHITPQKVLIKLYVANGVGSHRLKVLPVSQMSPRIDRERREHCWGVWFEDGFDLTLGLFASGFTHPPFSVHSLLYFGFEYYTEVRDTNANFMYKNAIFTENC